MGEDHTEVNKDVRDTNRVTITDAATLLGVHPNTVRGRVKVGI
jgi:DeoR/GlpR family transcriptional regulator of sugar metabolism